MSQIIAQTANLLGVEEDLVAKLSDYQFEYLEKFMLKPTTAEIYLKNLGTFYVLDYSVKEMISNWIKGIREQSVSKEKAEQFKDLINHWFKTRHKFYYLNRKIRRNPNMARKHIIETNRKYLKKLAEENEV